ncbi:MAG: hypothetical protein HY092_04120, partial [Candidatus Kerfeldbacteria bacterium]|nr:hypothetical protein [Candidatus Kerfeldbacteria bacterium]
MNTSRTTVWLIGLTLAGLVFAGAGSVRAQSDTNSGLAIDCEHFSANTNTSCQIDDFLNQFVVLSEYGLGLVGVLAVLMFVYGGFQYITAGGRASKVDEGTRVIQGTLIGIIISLIAYVIINFAVGAVTGTTSKGFS